MDFSQITSIKKKFCIDQIEEFIKIRKYEIMKILKKIKNLFVFNLGSKYHNPDIFERL